MGRNSYFQFKQFRINQEKAAMKVGIDGVLLGAWANLNGATRVLDVGAGTGLLALMVAQRCQAQVDAVELELYAAEEAAQNFQNSKWRGRLQLTCCSFQDYGTDEKYDHIISNPPFFENSPKSADQRRTQARHADTLSLKELLEKSIQLLTPNGKVSLILPSDKEKRLIELLERFDLTFSRIARVSPDEKKVPHRLLVELAKSVMTTEQTTITIREAVSGKYSGQYRELTKEFYLAI